MLMKWIKALRVYFNPRMLTMVGLGFSSGFPLLLVFSTLNLWLKDEGISYIAIGLFSLVKLPYSFKWLWAPLLDRLKLPGFGLLGRRRGWALFFQLLLMAGIALISTVDPATNLRLLAVLCVIVVIASASQDVVLDAYRIESFSLKEQGAGVAVYIIGYRIGTIASGAGAIWMASFMSWNQVYLLMALGTLVGILTILLSREPSKAEKFSEQSYKNFNDFMNKAVYDPFVDFMKRNDWALILAFIFFYRMSDSYMAPMAFPFYHDMGFSKGEIAFVSKIFGMGATIFGGLVGGLVMSRMNMLKGLMLCGILQGISNLMYVVQAYVGHSVPMLMLTLSFDNIAGGMASTALVAYLSSLCNVAYTATQYALLSSLMSLARDVFAASSGYMKEIISWPAFFLITTLMMIPGLALLWILMRLERRKYPRGKTMPSAADGRISNRSDSSAQSMPATPPAATATEKQ